MRRQPHLPHNRLHCQMTPPSWQRCLWLLLMLIYFVLSVQLLVVGCSKVQSQLATARVRRTLSVAEPAGGPEKAAAPVASKVANASDVSAVAKVAIVRTSTAKASVVAVARQTYQIKLAASSKPPLSPTTKASSAPTTLLGKIEQASQPTLHRQLAAKLESLGPASTEKQLEQAATRCAADKSAPAVRYVQSYAYLHRPSASCTGELLALIAVHSNAKNLARRAAIRRTWGSLRYVGRHRVDVMFFLGRPASGDSDTSGATGARLQALIDAESDRYGDVVQLDYTENYRNMTIKHLAVYEWTLVHCQVARHLVKVDDDTFADVAHLVTFLSRDPPPGFYCSATGGAKPQRVRRGSRAKWMVTQQEYPDKSYPAYCEGFGYILRTDRIADIYMCSFFKQFFWIDDVHVTGVLASAAGVPRNRFWRGHSYATMLPSQASETIMDYIFLTAEQSEFFESVWHKLWYAVLQHSLDINL